MKSNFFSFLLFFTSFNFSNGWASQASSSKPLLQRLSTLFHEQQQKALQNKMKRDAIITVGPVAQAYQLSERNRQHGKRMLLAISNLIRNNKEQDIQTSLQAIMQESNDPQALEDILKIVYKNKPKPSTIDINYLRIVQRLLIFEQQLTAAYLLLEGIYSLPDSERRNLIQIYREQQQYQLAQEVEDIGRLSQQEIVSTLSQIRIEFSYVQNYEQQLQHILTERNNKNISVWFDCCAHALESSILPSAREIKHKEQAHKDLKDLCNGFEQVNQYDAQTYHYFTLVEAIIPKYTDQIQKLSELEKGLNLLNADNVETKKEIISAYHKAATQCHPDKPEGSTEKFQTLGAAKNYKLKHPETNVDNVHKEIERYQGFLETLEHHKQAATLNYKKERKEFIQSILNRSRRPFNQYYPPHIPSL